tara:strand:+ start:16332 stop:17081 length:750 start_codon:yes stop_codon:yes gene_type:complete
MFMKKWYFSFLFFTLPIYSWGDVINIASINWAPFYGKDLKKDGVVSEIARVALERSGHKINFEYMPWKRAMKKTAKGKKYHGLFGCWYSKDREKDYIFSKETMLDGSPHFIAGINSPVTISKASDLKGLTIGIVRGYTTSEQVKELFQAKKTKKWEVSKGHQLFSLIEKKKVDVVLENQFVAQDIFKKKFPGKSYNFKKVGSDFFNGKLFMCWSKKFPGVKKIADDFDKNLKIMKSDGSLQKIKKEFNF